MAQNSAVLADQMVIRPLDKVMGAEVIGLDLRQPLSPETKQRLEDAFNEYKLLCFRDQDLTPDNLAEFTTHWGDVGEHTMPGQLVEGVRPDVNVASNATKEGKPGGKHPDPTAMRWHTDRSWRPEPVKATLLYGREVPSVGGDTLFCNTTAAYDGLPAEVKQRVDGMKVIHSVEYSRRAAGGHLATAYELKVAPPQAHPLARTHPATGKKALYAGSHAWTIEGMTEEEGRDFIDDMMEHATQPQFVYRHKWRRGDLVMWDDRCTYHAATPYDTTKEIRTMYRTVVNGDRPF